jgi:hypothetical protein
LDTWKVISPPVPITTSVEPPRMSTTGVGLGRRDLLHSGAEGREPRLFVAGEDVRLESPALPDAGELSAVRGVPDRAAS